MLGPYVHNIDPVITQVGGAYLWWYGASYSAGFVGLWLWLRRVRLSLKLTLGEVYDLSIFLAAGVLLGGRAVEVLFYEWGYYGAHPWHIPAYWLGGMATHGILAGAWRGCCYSAASTASRSGRLPMLWRWPGPTSWGWGASATSLTGRLSAA